MKFLMVIIMVYSSSCLNAQENILEDLLKSGNETLKQVYENSEKFEVQIIYTQINRDEQNFPSFTKYRFNVDPKRYFYPASTVKFPAAVLALEKINKLKNELTKYLPSTYQGIHFIIGHLATERYLIIYPASGFGV